VNGRAAKERARRRSENNSRLARKAATVEKTKAEQEFDRLMGEIRDERAAIHKDAGAVYAKAVKAAIADRKTAVQAADAAYVEKRDKIIKRLAAEETKAAA